MPQLRNNFLLVPSSTAGLTLPFYVSRTLYRSALKLMHGIDSSVYKSAKLRLFVCSSLSPAAAKAAALVACLVYMGISSALIVLNQQLMNEDGFRYPMALSGLGMGFSAVASYIACKVWLLAHTLLSICVINE